MWKILHYLQDQGHSMGSYYRSCDLPEMQNSLFVKYSVRKWDTVNIVWSVMSCRAHNLCQKFCPRQMMHSFHIKQANCQTTVWQQCHLQHPQLPPPETMEWKLEDSVFVSVLKSLPSGPDACADLIFRVCTEQCTRISCKCRMFRLPCTVTCKCHDTGNICYNGWRMMKCFIDWRYLLSGC